MDRRETFSDQADRATYLRLVGENLNETGVKLLGWCLMTNHVHLVATPEQEDSLSVLLRRVHGRYAQYYNARWGRTGHLWQNRFFACALGPAHLWAALAYVERNPVRAGVVKEAAEYEWSSAAAHVSGIDRFGIVDMEWWRQQGTEPEQWRQRLQREESEAVAAIRRCTYAGRPFGDESFVNELGSKFGRRWSRGRPRKAAAGEGKKEAAEARNQFVLF